MCMCMAVSRLSACQEWTLFRRRATHNSVGHQIFAGRRPKLARMLDRRRRFFLPWALQARRVRADTSIVYCRPSLSQRKMAIFFPLLAHPAC